MKKHQMQKLLAFFCAAACFFIQAVHLNGQSRTGTQNVFDDAMSSMDKAFNNVDAEFTQEDAYYLGRTVAANILAVYKPYTRNSALTQYLNRICQTLVINSSQAVSFNGYHVIILDSPEFNAFATPGGHIFITVKLVEAATSEDMLAAIVAHELAHIILKHGIAIINDMKVTEEMTATANRAADFAGKDNATAKRLMLFRNSVTKTMDTMLKNGYSQSQELEADREAVKILVNAGYDPLALQDMLKVLQRVQKSQKGGFNTTHPSPADRIKNVESMRNRANDTGKYRIPRFKNK
ncbi:MAG: M48 family metalloprotease [Treponema sp.]|nr:M48 family metalloprotease [Treponema sp.]